MATLEGGELGQEARGVSREISPARAQLLQKLLKQRGLGSTRPVTAPDHDMEGRIPVISRDRPLPLSFAQERLWFIDQLEPGSPAYYLAEGLRLAGPLDVPLLARSLQEIIRRHETLRTTFETVDGRAIQVVHPAGPARLPMIDLHGVPRGRREEELRRLAREEAVHPFVLSRGPLLRTTLVRVAAEEYVALLTMHHIISDAWSMGILIRELATLYNAFRQSRPSPLPELPVQYVDFAAWQRQWLSGQMLEGELSYWRERLAGTPALLELPTDRPRPTVRSYHAANEMLALSGELSEALLGLGRSEGTTPFITLLAIFQLLLARHTGQEDISVGAPIAGRHRHETEGLVGFFVNNLVLRGDLAGDPSTRELLARTRDVVLAAYSHQDLPFEMLVQALRPERTLSHDPLFQVALNLDNTAEETSTLADLKLSRYGGEEGGAAHFDLVLKVRTVGTRLAGSLEYRTDLFDGGTAARLAARFTVFLEAAAANPDLPLSELPLLLASERQQALLEWNDAGSRYPRESSIVGLFAAVAQSFPEAPAVVGDGEVWSYRRLDEQSSRLARRLRSMGVGPERVVGVAIERSPELILGILAVLKAGGAYLPLDTEYPDERLAFMLADTGAPVVLVHERTRQRLGGLARLLSVDEDGREDGAPLELEIPAESLALVIYTSGSTGRPKGVALAHRGIVRLVRDTDYLRLGPGDRMGYAANIGFDAATLEIWGALLNGAALVVIPREVALSPADLASCLRRDGVTALFLTTALFNQVAREAPEALADLRTMMFGGEAADPGAVARAVAGPERLVHLYGPAESTTLATWHRVQEMPAGAVTVPIGLPVGNSSAYVLDRWQGLVPPGVVGELCVGGDGLARGYLGRPDLTAERFIPHPWDLGERLYRTGDLARQRPDGAIEFMGRRDDQVKIRGFRIELGEVEVVLLAHPAVREAVVLAREERDGRRLVAWVAGDLEEPALRSWLRERLPDYMVPSAFVMLEALPLTPNGKVDRWALPEPQRVRLDQDQGMPADLVEELLAGIWCEVLGLGRIGVKENFFELGGHSLLATQVVSRVRGLFGVELPLRELFEAPTVERLAVRIEQARRSGRLLTAPEIIPVPRNGSLRLSFAQQRLWFLDRLEPESPAYNIPVALRVEGALSVPALESVLSEVVLRHEALRTSFGEIEGEPMQVIAPARDLSLPIVDLSDLPESWRGPESMRLVSEEARRPFDLSRGPLLRAALVRLGEAEHAASLTMHHIISDGWSRKLLVEEIGVLYGSFLEGRPSPLVPLAVQYADYAQWQRNWLSGEVLESELAYWRQRLGGLPPRLELSTDRPRPAVQTYRGASRPLALSRELSAGLVALGRREGATPFMTLLAGFQALLGRYSGQEDIGVGMPIAGRTRSELEGLIGFFVNTLVLRGDLSGTPSFRELLGRTRQVSLEAHEHQEVPFERLVEELAPERSLSYSPLFQVMFVLQNVPRQALDLPGLRLVPMESEAGTEKFDLTLGLVEEGGEILGSLDYSTDLFDGATVDRMLGHLERLLLEACASPER
ncbi:MAG TPA: amino acid adenylation domain-containing protein, partial [Thermoanaerobaculia bacterium]|nr:amino acid adenylation domain-containing protein [Thermoanaerobaculia bacterium]